MRSANRIESGIRDPPKPRLMTGTPGKSSASVFHLTMLDDPMNKLASFGGGCSLSRFSNARISFSNGTRCVAGALEGASAPSTRLYAFPDATRNASKAITRIFILCHLVHPFFGYLGIQILFGFLVSDFGF